LGWRIRVVTQLGASGDFIELWKADERDLVVVLVKEGLCGQVAEMTAIVRRLAQLPGVELRQ
jgi:hypothetical protein